MCVCSAKGLNEHLMGMFSSSPYDDGGADDDEADEESRPDGRVADESLKSNR
jgi:hypothetical protein